MKRTEFKLRKLKFLKGDGVEIKWQSAEIIDGETHWPESGKKTTQEIHNDLLTKIRSLDKIIMMLMCSFDISDNNDDDYHYRDTIEKITITALTLTGKSPSLRASISFKLEDDAFGQIMRSTTSSIYLDKDFRGFESELNSIISDIEDEVFSYLFDGNIAESNIQFGETISQD